MPKLFMYGIQRMQLLKNVLVLSGAGVGGGSLVYANTLYVPNEEFFKNDIIKKMGSNNPNRITYLSLYNGPQYLNW